MVLAIVSRGMQGSCDMFWLVGMWRGWVLFGRCLSAGAAKGQSRDCCSKHIIDSSAAMLRFWSALDCVRGFRTALLCSPGDLASALHAWQKGRDRAEYCHGVLCTANNPGFLHRTLTRDLVLAVPAALLSLHLLWRKHHLFAGRSGRVVSVVHMCAA